MPRGPTRPVSSRQCCCREKGSNAGPSPNAACSTNGKPHNVINQRSQNLHVLYAETDKTLAGVANFLSDPRRPIGTTLRAMMTTSHLGDRPHPVVASAARELLNKSENERSGVLSTAMSFLGLYRDPIVAKVTR